MTAWDGIDKLKFYVGYKAGTGGRSGKHTVLDT